MHYCVIKCKIPEHYSAFMGKRVLKRIVDTTLDEFGYLMPEEQIQEELNQLGECTKDHEFSILLTEEEAIKTACIRAEWKPLEPTAKLNKDERKTLKSMKRKRSGDCGICLETTNNITRTKCKHDFCYKCLKKWLAIKRECPVCQEPINVSASGRKKRRRKPCKKTLLK